MCSLARAVQRACLTHLVNFVGFGNIHKESCPGVLVLFLCPDIVGSSYFSNVCAPAVVMIHSARRHTGYDFIRRAIWCTHNASVVLVPLNTHNTHTPPILTLSQTMHTEAPLVIERVPHAHAYAHNTQHTYKHTSDGKSNLISGLELKARCQQHLF